MDGGGDEVDGEACLCLYWHIGGGGESGGHLQTLMAVCLCLLAHVGIVDDVEADESAVQLAVAHHEGCVHQHLDVVGVVDGDENLLVVQCRAVAPLFLVGSLAFHLQLLGGLVGGDGGDDARDENHHHHTVQHGIVHKWHTWSDLQVHAYHHHGQRTGCMGLGQAEHHDAFAPCHVEQLAADKGGQILGQGAGHDHDGHDHGGFSLAEHGRDVDQHAYANQEVGDEEGIADELDAAHQG